MNPRWEQLRRELTSPLPHPDPAALREMCDRVADWIVHDFATLPEQPVGGSASRAELEALLREPPPELGSDFARVLAEFQQKVVPGAYRIHHPRFLAFIPSGVNFVSVLADFLCSATNFFPAIWLEAAAPSQVELIVLDWFKQFLDYPPEASGILTSGGSEANLTALTVARERLRYEDRPRAVLYVSEERHWSIDRAAKIIGLRPDQLRPVATDERFRLKPAALREAVQADRRAGRLSWAVVANAGATNTGAVDPLGDVAENCSAHELWLHVDAAYGWPAVLVPDEKPALSGIHRADSITLDPHKWFGQPYEVGCVLIRDGRRLVQTFQIRPEYMQDVEPTADEVNFADRGPALSRRFRALKIWLSAKVLGIGWFRDLVAHGCRLAELAQGLLEASPRFEILSRRQLSIVCFRYVPAHLRAEQAQQTLDRLNLALVDRVRVSGRAFFSSTRLDGRVAARLCFVNWRTTAEDVEEVVRLVEEVGEQLAQEMTRAHEEGRDRTGG
jgi:glutamate/tyrosine decarboxylase-like PLP-dependent enzyme